VTPDSITMRFPNGAWEYGFMAKAPAVGDRVVRQGMTWVVLAVEDLGNDHHDVTMGRAPVREERDQSGLGS
jgi:hypothetical protein